MLAAILLSLSLSASNGAVPSDAPLDLSGLDVVYSDTRYDGTCWLVSAMVVTPGQERLVIIAKCEVTR